MREGAVRKIPIKAGIGKTRKRVGWRQTKNKWLAVRQDAEKEFRLFASAFGLTGPANRSALKVETGSSLQSNRELWELLTQPRPAKDFKTTAN